MTDKLEEAVAEALVGWSYEDETERQRQIDHARKFYTLVWRISLRGADAVIPIIRNAAMDEAAALIERQFGRLAWSQDQIDAILALKGER